MPLSQYQPLFIALVFSTACRDVAAPREQTVRFCDSTPPSWIAVRDETSTPSVRSLFWRRVNAVDGAFTFKPAEKLSIAYLQEESPTRTRLVVYRLAAQDLPQFACENNDPPIVARSHTGSVTGLVGPDRAAIVFGSGTAEAVNGGYSIVNQWGGSTDLLALTVAADSRRFIVLRNLDLADGAPIPLLDFGSAQAFSPVVNSLTITGIAAGETPDVQQFLRLNGRTPLTLLSSAGPVYSLPPDKQQAGDIYEIGVAVSSSTDEYRTVITRYRTAHDRVITMGPQLAVASKALIPNSHPARFQVDLPFQTEYGAMAGASFLQASGGTRRELSVIASRAYLGADSGNWRLEIPDFTGFDALSRAVAFTANDSISWGVIASGVPFKDHISGKLSGDEMIMMIATRGAGPGLAVR